MLKENQKMTDPWIHIVRSIEPRVKELQQILDQGSIIKPVLDRNRQGAWQITLDSNLNKQDIFVDYDVETFNDRIEWVKNELENWDAWRSSYDTWVFSSKEEAEKFITYYILRWASE